ncbi:MAG: AAA family ATPase [Anaerolineales bacterium]|nr:AAA family ATPase [Anaerolineales bacterium]
MPGELRAELLGGLALTWTDGERPEARALPKPPTAKSQSLLAYLLLYRNRAPTRDRLIGMFWPDRPEPRARRSLSTALWHLRRCLPSAAAIESDSQVVGLAPDTPVWVDVEALEALAARPKLEALETARSLYRGEFLEGLSDDWIVNERYRVQELYVQILTLLMTLYAEYGRSGDALQTAQQILCENPLREDAHRSAMLAYARLGRRISALQQFETCRQALQADLATGPAAETLALRQAILEGQIEPTPAAEHGVATPLPPARRDPLDSAALRMLAGRTQELSTLEARWAAAREGRGSLVLLQGEAGIGKTRLVEALSEAARVTGGRVLWGRCFEFERMLPYQPVTEALRPLLTTFDVAQWGRLPPWAAAALARLLPDLVPVSASAVASVGGLEATRLFEALALCLSPPVTRWPTLLVLDDLHWASESTLQLLHYLARRLPGTPVLCVTAYRRDASRRQRALAAFAGEVEQERLAQVLPLERLSAAAVADWVRRQSGLGDAAAPLSTWLFQETLGNPFFMIETVRTLFETDHLRFEHGRWAGDLAGISTGASPLPDRISAAVQERVSRLDEQTQSALRLAAVLGREFDFEVFAAAWDQGTDSALESLETLARHDLIEEGRGQSGRDYAFTHHKIQESVYQETPRRRRQRLHARAALVLEQLSEGNVDDAAPELAHHFDHARRLDPALLGKAVAYWRRAGEAAAARFANSEAGAYFQRALDLAPAGDPGLRFALLGAREALWHLQGDRPAQARDLAALETVAPAAGVEAQAEAALRRAAYEAVIGHYRAAIAAAQAAFQHAEAAGAAALQVRAHYQWAMACFHAGDFATAHAQFSAGLRLAEAAALPRLEADTRLGQSLVAWRQGQYAEVTAHALRARALYQQIGNARGEGNVLQQLGIAARYQDQYQSALDYFQASLTLWQHIGERRGEGFALVNLGVVALDQSQFQAARDYFEQARVIWREINNPDGENTVLGNLAAVALRQGDYHTAQDFARLALAICRRIANRHGEGVNQYLLGYALAESGAPDEAREQVEAALQIALELKDQRYEALAHDGLGRVALCQLDFPAARSHFEQAAGLAHDISERANESEFRLMLGLAAARQGDFDFSQAQLEQAQALAARVGDPLRQAAIEAAQAERAYRQGHAARALERAQPALETAARLGARALQAETLLIIGHAHARQRAWAEARHAYAEAQRLFQDLRLEHRLPEATDGLARAGAQLAADY